MDRRRDGEVSLSVSESLDGEFWFSTFRMTVWVRVRDGRVVDCAPVVRKFIGQPAKNLVNWLRQHGGFCSFKFQEQRNV